MTAHKTRPDSVPDEVGGDDDAVELFPVNFTTYRHHTDLDTEHHVATIARLLTPYGLHLEPWPVVGEERDRQAVEERLEAWADPSTPTGRGNTILYWVGHGCAHLLAHHRTSEKFTSGVTAEDVAIAINARQAHPDNADSWAIIVLDACFSHAFAKAVHIHLLTGHPDARRYLLLSTAAESYAELGAFTRALDRALNSAFLDRDTIGLVELGVELARDLGGYRADTADNHETRLVNRATLAAFNSSLDQRAELQALINDLPADERRHFLPKASGAELGELAWYFHGRTLQRDHILRWLTTATSTALLASTGMLIVTGPAGAGKSALLGHVLLHTNPRLRDVLTRHGHLTPLPPGTPCPDDPFDLVVHLAGLTLHHTIGLIATATGLPHLADQAAAGQAADLPSRLITELASRGTELRFLFDALDEADQPLLIADRLLRPLAALPGVRLIIGTRRSTHEGPDHPAPTDTDLLDTLRPRPTTELPAPTVELVDVDYDPEALAGYLRAKLVTAKQRGTLNTDDTAIANAVHRLVTDHPDHAGQQQFLYARLAAHELLHNPHLITDPTPLIGQTHRRLFTRALERLHHADPRYTPLLQALGLAQGRGLPDQDNIWATAADALHTGPVDTRGAIPALLRDAAPYLALDQEHGQSVYRLAHRTFTEHFTTSPDTDQAHADITTALTRHALDNQSTPGTESQPEQVSPYTRYHLAAHARLGHTAGGLRILAHHPQVLDLLDLTSITTAALHHGQSLRALPPAIAGTVLLQHHAHDATTPWRQWWRRLGTTYIQGTPPPAEPRAHTTGPSLPTLTGGTVRPRQLHLQLVGHTNGVNAVAVFTTSDGAPRLATAGREGTVRIWDPTTGTQVGEPLTGHDRAVTAVAVFTAPDGTPRLATTSDDRTVRIWDPTHHTQIGKPLTGHTYEVKAVAVFTAPDGTPRLATGGNDGAVRIWDPSTHSQIGEPLTGHTAWVQAVAVFTAPDGTPRLATTSDDRTVRIWDPSTRTQIGEPLRGHTDWVHAVGVFTAPDGTPRLATGGSDHTVCIWDPSTHAQIGEPLTGHDGAVTAVAVFTAPDGTPRLATSSHDMTVRIWDPSTHAQIGEPLTGHDHVVNAVAVFTAPDGTPRLATTSDDHTVRIWDPSTHTQIGEPLTGHISWVNALAVFTAPDGSTRLSIASDIKGVRIWDLSTHTQIGEPLTGHDRWVTAVAVFTAPDGTPRLATGGSDHTVRIWDPSTHTQIGEPLTGHDRWVKAVAVFTAPDGTPRLATTSGDHTVRIWDPSTHTQIGEPLTGHTDWVNAVAVFTAPDGTPRLATTSGDHTVRIWDPSTHTQIGEPLTGHDGAVTAVAVFTAPDGTPRLATSSHDMTVRIWDPSTHTQIGEPLTGHTYEVKAVAVFTAPDGTPRLATGGKEGVVGIWDPHTRTGYALPLIDGVQALTVSSGLLIIGTEDGHLVMDIGPLRSTAS